MKLPKRPAERGKLEKEEKIHISAKDVTDTTKKKNLVIHFLIKKTRQQSVVAHTFNINNTQEAETGEPAWST